MTAPKLSFNAIRRLVVLACLLGVCLAGEPAADAREISALTASGVPSSALAWHVPAGARLSPEALRAVADPNCQGHPALPPTSRSLPPASGSGRPGTGTLADTGGGRSAAALLMGCALLVSGLVFRHAARRRRSDLAAD